MSRTKLYSHPYSGDCNCWECADRFAIRLDEVLNHNTGGQHMAVKKTTKKTLKNKKKH